MLPARCMSLVFIAQSITMPRPIKLTCPTALHLTPHFQLLFTAWYDRFCEFISPFFAPVLDSPPIPLFLQVLFCVGSCGVGKYLCAFSVNLSFVCICVFVHSCLRCFCLVFWFLECWVLLLLFYSSHCSASLKISFACYWNVMLNCKPLFLVLPMWFGRLT